MPQIPSNKPDRTCPYCGKIVKNLGFHIANQHPKVLTSLEENPAGNVTPSTNQTPNPPKSEISPEKAGFSSINEMIKEKLDTMLNIKIIEMLSQGATIKDIKETIEPTQKQTFGLSELKEFHDIVYSEKPNVNFNVDSGSEWPAIISNALPIISQMVNNKTNNEVKKENDTEYRTIEEGTLRPIKPIQAETPTDTTEPRSPGEEPRNPGDSEQ